MARLLPVGGTVTPEARRLQEQADRWRVDALDRTRRAAAGWATALTSASSLTAVLSVFLGADKVKDVAAPWSVAIGGAMLVCLLLAGTAIMQAFKAAHGVPAATWTSYEEFQRRDHDDLRSAVDDLAKSRRHALGAAAALLLAAAMAWYGTSSDSSIRVVRGDGTALCASESAMSHLVLDPAAVASIYEVDRC